MAAQHSFCDKMVPVTPGRIEYMKTISSMALQHALDLSMLLRRCDCGPGRVSSQNLTSMGALSNGSGENSKSYLLDNAGS